MTDELEVRIWSLLDARLPEGDKSHEEYDVLSVEDRAVFLAKIAATSEGYDEFVDREGEGELVPFEVYPTTED